MTKVNLARERLTRQAERLAREEAEEEQEGAGPQRRPPPPSSYEVDEGLDELTYEWGSWICEYCSSVNPPKAYACQSYYQGEECRGTYEYNFAGWAPSKEPRQKTAKKQKMTLLEEQLLKESWTCSRCSAGNLVYRVKCFKCSLKRPEPEGDASSGSEDDYRPRRTAATEEAAEAFLRSRQDLGLRKHRKRGGTRHKKKTKKVKKRLAAGSAFRGPRAVVGGHSAFRTKRKRSSAGWPAAERASRRSRAVRPKRSTKKLRRASWARSRKSRNRSMHAMNGNSLGAKQFLAACSCLLAIPVIRETDDVIGVASEAVQDIILEGGNQIRETMTTVSMTCQVVTIWFIAMKILNWMQRCRNGNTVVTEAKLVHLDGDTSLWSVGSHRVRFKGNTASCVCHGYLNTGKCAHLEAARVARRELGIVAVPALEDRVSRKSGSSSRPSSVVERGKIATASMESVKGLGACFHGLVEKAKAMGQNRVGLDRSREDQAALAVVSRLGAVPQPLMNQNGPNVKFLMCREAHDEIQWLLSTQRERGVPHRVHL